MQIFVTLSCKCLYKRFRENSVKYTTVLSKCLPSRVAYKRVIKFQTLYNLMKIRENITWTTPRNTKWRTIVKVQRNKRKRFQNINRTRNASCLRVDVQACTHRCIHRVKTIRVRHQAYLSFFLFSFGATTPSAPWPPHSRGFYITHNNAPQLVWLLWTSDQLVAENSTWQNTTLTADRHP
jgi:hypothetical protein